MTKVVDRFSLFMNINNDYRVKATSLYSLCALYFGQGGQYIHTLRGFGTIIKPPPLSSFVHVMNCYESNDNFEGLKSRFRLCHFHY